MQKSESRAKRRVEKRFFSSLLGVELRRRSNDEDKLGVVSSVGI
jgi:hypothetical protein